MSQDYEESPIVNDEEIDLLDKVDGRWYFQWFKCHHLWLMNICTLETAALVQVCFLS